MHPVPATIASGYGEIPRRMVRSGIRGRDPFQQRANRNRISWIKGKYNANGDFVYRDYNLHSPTWRRKRV